MSDHTVKAYAEELQHITAEVVRMGGLAEAQVADALEAFARRDAAMARAVVERDSRVDALQKEVERRAIRLLVLRQPVASDMRQTISAFKVAMSLERTADLAKNIAKRSLQLADIVPDLKLMEAIDRMGRLVLSRLKEVLDAFADNEIERAIRVWMQDDEVDEHFESLFRELMKAMRDDPTKVDYCAHLLFVAKNLERIGDHATNVAEIIHYIVTGEEIGSQRPRGGINL
jgi:phosphate transport system protein